MMAAQPVPKRPRPSFDIRPLMEEELQQIRDHDWLLRDSQLVRQYAGQIVAVFRARVWGHGPDHETAIDNATAALQQGAGTPELPSLDQLTYVVVPEMFADEPSLPLY